MTNHIIPLQRTATGNRLAGARGFPGRAGTTREGQARRLGARLNKIFGDALDRSDTEIASDPTSMAPERVLVFEIIGQVTNFATAARRVGLYWLAERIAVLDGVDEYVGEADVDRDDDDEDEDPDDVPSQASVPDKGTSGRFYMAMPTKEAFETLRRLWSHYESGGKFPDNHSNWWQLFDRLHDLRPWGPSDRVPEETRAYIKGALSQHDTARLEIDLWFRDDPELRASLIGLLSLQVEELGGQILDTADKPEIRYHAALAQLPAPALDQLLAASGVLASSQYVMSIRPQSMFKADQTETDATETPMTGLAERDPRPALAALFDGFPVSEHLALENRLDIIEVDVEERLAPLPSRKHGTTMASLILHGDMQSGGPSISRSLKVVPVLALGVDGIEQPPPGKLILNLIFGAVEALKAGRAPAGPDVIIVNHSICDEANPFTGAMSPWSRALDYLAYTYKVLFVASAGNIRSSFAVEGFADIPGFRSADPAIRRTAILKGLEAAKAMRGILTPGESVNALTVGAAHADGAAMALPGTLVDPFGPMRMANLGSALGLGYGHMVKPDLLMDGGRQAAMPSGAPMRIHGFDVPAFFGQQAACPDTPVGSTGKKNRTSGTSNAAALTTRAGLLVADALDDTYADAATPWHKHPAAACMVKALVAHSSSWGEVGDGLEAAIGLSGGSHAVRRRENISRYIGYGPVEIDRVITGGTNRATLLARDSIRVGKRHIYKVPLPDAFGRRESRRITITLAWLTPTLPEHSNYRAVDLQVVGEDGGSEFWPGVVRSKSQPPAVTSRRGTLLHAVYEGRSAVAFAPGSSFTLNVQAVSRSTGLTKMDVPYALAVTIEMLTDVEVDVFQSIETRLRPRVNVR